MFGNAKDATLVNERALRLIGGILALHITGINFSISAGIGFIALFGVCIQNGVILDLGVPQEPGRRQCLWMMPF
jgi:cobalt-zinc-cadmium resistance protein CzcA